MASFKQYLKKNYGFSIIKDASLNKHRKLHNQNKRILNRKEKEINLISCSHSQANIYDKEVLGMSTPGALLNTIWFNNSIHFSLCRCKAHQDMCRGDMQLLQTTNGEEF